MVAPIIWAGMAVAGLWGGGWFAKETGDAITATQKLTKTVVIGGGLYVSYRALQSAGALK